MQRIKTDKLSGKDKARYLKSLREKQKVQAAPPKERTFAPVSNVPQRVDKKPSVKITPSQLVSKGRDVNKEQLLEVSVPQTIDTNGTVDGTSTEERKKETNGLENTGNGDAFPAGFFDEGVEDIPAAVEVSEETTQVAAPNTASASKRDELDAFMNELDNMPSTEEKNSEEGDSGGEEEEQAVQLAYETKVARLLQRVGAVGTTAPPATAEDVLDEADSVLMNYTSSVPASEMTSETSSTVPLGNIADEVLAALARKKKKRKLINLKEQSTEPLEDLMDWTAKYTR